MARILRTAPGADTEQARALLVQAGVQLLPAVDEAGGVDPAILELLLPPPARFVREVITAQPPSQDQVDSGMGAWHVNSVDEVHSVLDGEGVMEFITAQGVVSVLVEGGDVVVIQQAEHRYRPLAPQRWAVRWSGDPQGQLEATATGRAPQPWPLPTESSGTC